MKESAIPRSALVAMLDRARQALSDGEEAEAERLLDELHWFGHGDAHLHEAVHRLQLGRARRRGEVAGVVAQLLPIAFARATSWVESLGPSHEVVQSVAAPPAVVYRVLADVAAYTTWNPWVVHAAGDARVGQRITVRARLGEGTMRVDHRVLVANPGQRFAWCDVGWFTLFASGRRVRWIEETPEGARLVSRIVLYGPFAYLAWALHGAAIRDGLAAEARALGERAEQIARTARPRAATDKPRASSPASDLPLQGKTCVITGPTRGIGRPTALWLAARGARVLLLCRDRQKGDALARELAERGGQGVVVPVDLASLRSVAQAAAQVRELAPRLDVLINNGGVLNHERRLSADGFEEMFGVNLLAHFLLTKELLPSLQAAPAGRIVQVSSNTHTILRGFDHDDYNWERRRFISFRAYAHSKLGILLFNRALARRLADTPVITNALHPGIVSTGMGTDHPALGGLLTPLVRPLFLTPEEGAMTSVFVATSPSVARHRGAYFVDCRPARPSRAVENDAAAERLFQLGERLLAAHGFAAAGRAA
jgi:retinol dehydrogenase-12